MEKVIRFSVSLPENLLGELDKKVEDKSYASRSEFIRDLIRKQIVKDKWQNDNEELLAVLTMVYSHHENDVLSKMMQIEHDAKVNITCTTHIHINHDSCLETVCLRGFAKDIEKFSDALAGLKGVKFTKLTKIAVPVS